MLKCINNTLQNYLFSKGKIQIIGVGGINTPIRAFEKLNLGASAIQLYSSLVYDGISIVNKILIGLINLSVNKETIRSDKSKKWILIKS